MSSAFQYCLKNYRFSVGCTYACFGFRDMGPGGHIRVDGSFRTRGNWLFFKVLQARPIFRMQPLQMKWELDRARMRLDRYNPCCKTWSHHEKGHARAPRTTQSLTDRDEQAIALPVVDAFAAPRCGPEAQRLPHKKKETRQHRRVRAATKSLILIVYLFSLSQKDK